MKKDILIILLISTIITLLIIINNKNNEIESISNTEYEFCYTVDTQEVCGYQKIQDYLNNLD